MITINDSCRHIRYNVWIDDIPSIYSKYLDVLEEDIIKDKWIKWESEVAKKYLNEIPCSPGTITFDIGAHGYVGSGSVIFGTVTELLLKLLSNNRKNDTKGIEKILIN